MTHPTIRQAIPSDEAAIRACAKAAYQRYVAVIGREPAPMVADFAAQIAARQIHVAVNEDGVLLGFVVCFAKQDRQTGDHMFLENIAVSPDAAGHGIGKALMAFCEDQARQTGLDEVRLYTKEKMVENLSIYPHLGYEETDRRQEDGFNRVFFKKKLI